MRILSGLLITFLFLIPTLLLANLIQCSAIVLLPFSKKAFRKVNGQVARCWWSMTAWCAENIQGVKIEIRGEPIPDHENALLIVNHRGLIDPLALLCLGYRHKRLQDMKYFVKDVLKFVPGVGWGLYFLDNIFLRREWTKDKASIEKTFHKIRKERIPIWLVAFVEGTRRTEKKLKASQEYALLKKMTPLKHLLTPRRKGFVATIAGLRSHLHAIYDVTLVYEKTHPTLLDPVLGRLGTVTIYLRRYDISTLPHSDRDLGNWLTQLFVEKDEIIEHHIQQ